MYILQVRDEDLEKFDAKVRTLQTDAVVAVTDFLNSHGYHGGQSPLRELSSNRIGPNHPKSFGKISCPYFKIRIAHVHCGFCAVQLEIQFLG